MTCAGEVLGTRNAGAAERTDPQLLGDPQAELFHVRIAVNQVRAELNHTLEGATVPPDLEQAIASTARTLIALDGVIARIHHRLAQRRSTGA